MITATLYNFSLVIFTTLVSILYQVHTSQLLLWGYNFISPFGKLLLRKIQINVPEESHQM